MNKLGFLIRFYEQVLELSYYNLSHSQDSFINNYILKKAFNLYYTSFKKVIKIILYIDCYYIIIRKDIKDTYDNILITSHI